MISTPMVTLVHHMKTNFSSFLLLVVIADSYNRRCGSPCGGDVLGWPGLHGGGGASARLPRRGRADTDAHHDNGLSHQNKPFVLLLVLTSSRGCCQRVWA
jgi:hypothetical protein